MKIVHENCQDLDKVNNSKLPNTAYVVTYLSEGSKCFDIAVSQKKVNIFDHYYDKYKKDLIDISQAKGTISPRLWKGVEKDG